MNTLTKRQRLWTILHPFKYRKHRRAQMDLLPDPDPETRVEYDGPTIDLYEIVVR